MYIGITSKTSRPTPTCIYYYHYRNQLLCRLPRQTAKARMADSKGLCHLPRTAKGSGKVGIGKELLCRLLFEADGKGAFAISG